MENNPNNSYVYFLNIKSLYNNDYQSTTKALKIPAKTILKEIETSPITGDYRGKTYIVTPNFKFLVKDLVQNHTNDIVSFNIKNNEIKEWLNNVF